MELVLVERRFSRPTRFEDIQALEDEGAWCLKAHGVRFLRTFFSRDGKRMLCLYEAPDAEAVRLAETQARVPFDNVWTCARLHSDRPAVEVSAPEVVIVERAFPESVVTEAISGAMKRISGCLEIHRSTYVESFIRKDGMAMVCVFRAPDAEAVRMANREAGMPFTDAWTASVFEAEDA